MIVNNDKNSRKESLRRSMFESISFNFTIGNFNCNSFITDIDSSTRIFDLYSNQTSENTICLHCGSRMHVYDNASVKLREIPFNSLYYTIFRVHVHRYRCPNCRASFTENIPFKCKNARITDNAAEFVKTLLTHRMSIKDISLMTGINWNTISLIHKDFMKEELDKRKDELRKSNYKPKYLAVDEFAIHKGHSYATCVMDLELGDVIWVGKGRAIKDFKKFFEDIPKEYLSDVEAVAMDMNASYNRLVEKNMPHADIVYDRYHMQAQFGKNVLGVVRLDEARIHREKSKRIKDSITSDMNIEEKRELKDAAKTESTQYKNLKKARWSLLSNSDNLTEKKSNHLQEILNSHSNLATCYAMKEEMCRLYECDDIGAAEEGWKNWFEAAKESGIPALVRFADIKEKRLPGLINHAKHQISTGRLEGFNNKIKVAKRIGYGYRNDDHFFTLIKFLSIPRAKYQPPRKK